MNLDDAAQAILTGETHEERLKKQQAVLRSAERVAKTLKAEAAQSLLDSTEIALWGRLLDGTEGGTNE